MACLKLILGTSKETLLMRATACAAEQRGRSHQNLLSQLQCLGGSLSLPVVQGY